MNAHSASKAEKENYYLRNSMILDERTKQGRLSRRDFLELTGLGIGALALGQCKSNPTGPKPPEPPKPPTTVNLQFNIYNHTLGPIKNYGLKKF
jgi:hypothetical protein